MNLIPENRPLTDNQIKRTCLQIRRLFMCRSKILAPRLALIMCDQLEAAGVTEKDLDRLGF